MTTLRVRLAEPVSSESAAAWALFDANGACVRSGSDRRVEWPSADKIEVVLAASQCRITSIELPPLSPSRVAGAAKFALEDQLAGQPDEQHLAASNQQADGRVRVAVVSRRLVTRIAHSVRGVSRIVAECDLAGPQSDWRWCACDDSAGFVARPDGTAFSVDSPSRDAVLPSELALALEQAKRTGAAPPHVRVDAAYDDAALQRWQREAGIPFVRGTPWRWEAAPPAAFAGAINLMPTEVVAESMVSRGRIGRAFAPALWLLVAALALHVTASVVEWSSLRIDRWREAREWSALAAAAGVASNDATSIASAREAISRRYAELRHAQGLPAPDDALPLLARAAPALSSLPAGGVKSIVYSDGHWTLEVARADAAAIANLDVRMRGAGLPALIATSAAGARLRFGGP